MVVLSYLFKFKVSAGIQVTVSTDFECEYHDEPEELSVSMTDRVWVWVLAGGRVWQWDLLRSIVPVSVAVSAMSLRVSGSKKMAARTTPGPASHYVRGITVTRCHTNSSLKRSMSTLAQAQAEPAQEAEETTFQKFAKVAQVHRHSFSLMIASNFL